MRILFTSNPLVGHWLPMLPLARAAQMSGHDVVVASGPDAVDELDRRGFTAWSVGPDFHTVWNGMLARQRAEVETEEQETLAAGLAMFATPAKARLHDLLDRTDAWPPDIVVREIYEFSGLYVPAKLQVVHGLGTHDPNFIPLRDHALAQLQSTLGQPAWPESMANTWFIDIIPPRLQPPDAKPFAKVVSMRPGGGQARPREAVPNAVLAMPYDRTVYLTLGTVFNSAADFALPLRALDKLSVNVVATCGFDTDPAAFQPLPDNVLVEQYVSQALLLPRCSAVICHGGAGTVIGALAHGLPLVCLPRGADQFANAAQVARVGAGISLHPDQISMETIYGAAQRVLHEPSFSVAARDLRTEIDLMREPSAVVEDITRAASSAHPGAI